LRVVRAFRKLLPHVPGAKSYLFAETKKRGGAKGAGRFDRAGHTAWKRYSILIRRDYCENGWSVNRGNLFKKKDEY